MGLLLGVAAGAALIEILGPVRPHARGPRDRRPGRRSPAVDRLDPADDAFSGASAEPARGGPADRRDDRRRRTRRAGRSSNARSVWHPRRAGRRPAERRRRDPLDDPGRRLGRGRSGPAGLDDHQVRLDRAPRSCRSRSAAAMDPMLSALRSTRRRPVPGGDARDGHVDGRRARAPGARRRDGRRRPGRRRRARSAAAAAAAAEAGPCADLRRVADERCELADPGPRPGRRGRGALRAAQRAYDDHESRADAGRRGWPTRAPCAPPRTQAQAAFRHDRSGVADDGRASRPPRAPGCSRSTGSTARRARPPPPSPASARPPGAWPSSWSGWPSRPTPPGSRPRPPRPPAWPPARPRPTARSAIAAEATAAEPLVRSGAPTRRSSTSPSPSGSLATGGTPRIFRLLRGDRAAMDELVDGAWPATIAEERRRWQLALRRPGRRDPRRQHRGVGASHFPDGHPFWGPFSLDPGPRHRRARCRRSATGSTGSAAGSTDASRPSATCRWPSATPGLDPMRIRHWPNETEMAELFADVTVAADEHLAGGGRRPDPGRAGVDARAPRRRPGRGLEPVGPPPAAPARGALTGDPSGVDSFTGSSSMTMTRSASAAASPTAAPSSAAQARMRSARPSGSRIWLRCSRRAASLRSSVGEMSTQAFGVVRPEQVQPADGVGGQPVAGQPREGHRVARGRVDGVDGGHPGGAMVGVVHAHRRRGRSSPGRSPGRRPAGTSGSRGRAARAGRGRWPARRRAGAGSVTPA